MTFSLTVAHVHLVLEREHIEDHAVARGRCGATACRRRPCGGCCCIPGERATLPDLSDFVAFCNSPQTTTLRHAIRAPAYRAHRDARRGIDDRV